MANTKDILRSFMEDRIAPGSMNERIGDDTSFLDSGIIDSTGVLELVDFLDEEFGVEVEDSELIPENLDSINKISAYLGSKGIPAAGTRDT